MGNLEIWKDVLGFEDYYSVSSFGNVYSKRADKNLSPGDNGSGYLFIHFRVNGIIKREYLHRLVANHFIDNKENRPQVNHKDCDKSNNNVVNLEWNTILENMSHASKNKRLYTSEYQKQQTSKANSGVKSHLSKLNDVNVREIKNLLKNTKMKQKEIAVIYGVCASNIGYIHLGKTWKHIKI